MDLKTSPKSLIAAAPAVLSDVVNGCRADRTPKLKRDQASENQRADANKLVRLANTAVRVGETDARSAGELGYLPQWMVHASLPYVQPRENPPAWFRRSGKLFFTLQPGYYQRLVETTDSRGRCTATWITECYGYPFGSLPRLIMAWLATEVALRKTRDIYLGDSLADFMRAIGKKNATGGERGTITQVKDMMQRLFTSSMHITSNPLDKGQWTTNSYQIVDSACLDQVEPGNQVSWKSRIPLSEKFFFSVSNALVPVDMRILVGLSRSPIAMDIYSWLTYRFSHLNRETLVEWEHLMQRFGTDTKDRYKFRELFERHLRSVITLYPRARVDTNHIGVILRPSPTSIPRLITTS